MTLARRPRLDPTVASGYLAPYNSWSHRRAVFGFVDDIPGRHEHPTWYTLADVERCLPTLADRPALLVWGMRDRFFESRMGALSVRHCADASLVELPDAGHWLLHEEPERTSREMIEFFHE